MITKLITEKDGEKGLDEAARLLKDGELVAIPTETVYGLAANALDGNAVKNIFVAKGRPQDNPLIVHICGMEMLHGIVSEVPERAKKLAAAFWPRPCARRGLLAGASYNDTPEERHHPERGLRRA